MKVKHDSFKRWMGRKHRQGLAVLSSTVVEDRTTTEESSVDIIVEWMEIVVNNEG